MGETRRVYYMTGAMTGIACIAMQRLKVSRFNELNDPFELLSVNVTEREVRRAIREVRNELDKAKGLICFTPNWKSPLMWGHYAEKHTGFALGFDIPSELLKDVEYENSLFDLNLDPETKKPGKLVLDRLIITKFADWGYENECRMFLDLTKMKAEGAMYFEPFSKKLRFREIVLGPRCTYKIGDIRALAKRVSSEEKIKVAKARIAFSRFEVRVNKVASALDKKLEI